MMGVSSKTKVYPRGFEKVTQSQNDSINHKEKRMAPNFVLKECRGRGVRWDRLHMTGFFPLLPFLLFTPLSSGRWEAV